MPFLSFLPFVGPLMVLMLACPLTSAAPSTSTAAPNADERIRVDFKDSPGFTHQGGTFRTLTINVDSAAAYPDTDMYLRVENVKCPENANSGGEVLPCLSVNFSPETRLSRLFVFITNVSSPSAVAINVGGSLSEAYVSLEGIVGCKRVGAASCVSFSVATEGVFNNSLFDAGGVDPTDYPLNGPDGSRKSSDLIAYNLRGFVVNSRFDHEFLRFPIASTDEAKIAAPLRISGTLGTDDKVVGSTFTFTQLSCITLDLRGSLSVGSSIVIAGSYSTIRDDRVVLRLRMTRGMLTLSNNRYNYIDIGQPEDRSHFFASTIAISRSSISDIPGVSGFGIFFDGGLNLGSKLVISKLQENIFGALKVQLSPVISGASSVTVSGCAMNGIALSPRFSEDCTTNSSCIVSVEGNSAYDFDMRNAYLSQGAYVSIANNIGWRGSGSSSIRDFAGPGVVSYLNNKLTLSVNFDGFSGTFEAWNISFSEYRFNGTLSFNTVPMPKRVTLSAIAYPIEITGHALDNNESRAEALASLYFGCASVFEEHRPLTPTVVCTNATVMRRCDEGLSVYSKSSRGYREEYTMRGAVETCNSQQRDAPPFDESIVIDFAKTPNVLMAHANYYSLTLTLISSEENAAYADLHSTYTKGKSGFTLDLQSINCVQRHNGNESNSNETLPDVVRPCVTIIVPAEGSEGIDNTSSLLPSLRGLSIRASEIGVSGPSTAIEMHVRGSLIDSEVYITGVRNCNRTSGRPCVAFEVSETASFAGSSFSLADTVITAEITDTAAIVGDDEVTSLLAYNLTGDVSNTVFSHHNLSFGTPTSRVAPVRVTGFVGSAVNSSRWSFTNLASVSLNLTGSLRDRSSFTVKNCSSSVDDDRVAFNINVTDGSVGFYDTQYNNIYIGAAPDDARTVGLPRVVFSKTSVTFHESDATFIINSTSPEDANRGVFFYADLVSGSRLVASNWRRKSSTYRGLLSFFFAGEVSGRASVMVTNCEAKRISLFPNFASDCTVDRVCTVTAERNAVYGLSLGGSMTNGSYALLQHNHPISEESGYGYSYMERMRGDGVISYLNNSLKVIVSFFGFVGQMEIWGNTFDATVYNEAQLAYHVATTMPKRVTIGWNNFPISVSGPVLTDPNTRDAAIATLYFSCAEVYFDKDSPFPPVVPCNKTATMRRCDEGLAVYAPSYFPLRHEYAMRHQVESCLEKQLDMPERDEVLTFDYNEKSSFRLENLKFRTLTINLIRTVPTPAPDNETTAAVLASPMDENELREDPLYLDIENITCTTNAAEGTNGLASPCVRIIVQKGNVLEYFAINVKNVLSPRALQIDVNGILFHTDFLISGINNCMRSNGECIQLNLAEKGWLWHFTFTVADSLLATYEPEGSLAASRFVDYNLFGKTNWAVFSHYNIVFDTKGEIRTGPVKIAGLIRTKPADYSAWHFRDLQSVSFDLTGVMYGGQFSVSNSSSHVLNDEVHLNVNFSESVVTFKNLKYNYIYLGDSRTSRIAVLTRTKLTFEDMYCALINDVLANANKGVSLFTELLGFSNVVVSRFSDSGLDSLSVFVRGKVGGKSSIGILNSSLDTVSVSPQFADDCTPALPCQITIDSNAVRTFDLGGKTTNGSLVVFSNNRPHQRYASGITRVGEDFAGSGIVSHLNNEHRIEMKFKEFGGSLEIWGSSYEQPHNNTLSFLSTDIIPSRISLSSIEHPIIIDGLALDDEKTRLAAFTSLRFGCATVVHDAKDDEYRRLVPPSVDCTEKAVMRRCEEGLSSYKLKDAAHNHRMEYVNRGKVEACTAEQQVVPDADADGDDEDDESSKRKKMILAVTLVMVGVVCVLGVVIFVIVRRRRNASADASRYEMAQEGDTTYGTNLNKRGESEE